MEIKKNEKVSLENKRLLFFEAGAIAALLVVLYSFSYSTKARKVTELIPDKIDIIEEDVIPTNVETPPPPPEVPQMPVITELIEIVDNDVLVETNWESLDDAKDFNVVIKDYIPEEQEEEDIAEEFPVYAVEKKPSFQGGDANAFSKWVNSHLTYPEIAKDNGVQGRVTLQFTVNPDGSVSNVKVLRGVDPTLDREAVRVVSNSPKWEPGRQRDRAVKVSYTFPVIFQLR